MLVLDAFKGQLTPDIKASFTGSSMITQTLRSYLGSMTAQVEVLDGYSSCVVRGS